MSAICDCQWPEIRETSSGEKFCERCGYWWSPKHGSTLPGERREIHQPLRIEKLGRNEPCRCGSGKKFKNCCQRLIIKIKSERRQALFARARSATNADDNSSPVTGHRSLSPS